MHHLFKRIFHHAPRNTHRGGFTLIELLVVVLIIGILASTALPQYQRAVEKSRGTQALTLLKSVYQAAETFYMANGNFPTEFSQLDIDIPYKSSASIVPGSTQALADSYWGLELINWTKYKGFLMTRLSGPYKGSQFLVWKEHEAANVPKDQIICGEQVSGSYAFTKPEGEFCVKLFRGVKKAAGSGGRMYAIPL